MSEPPFNYDDVKGYTLDANAERELIEAQNECTFMWSTRDGWPVGVIMSYVHEQGCFWLSVSSLRVRVQAIERDPRASIDHRDGRGSGIGPGHRTELNQESESLIGMATGSIFGGAAGACRRSG